MDSPEAGNGEGLGVHDVLPDESVIRLARFLVGLWGSVGNVDASSTRDTTFLDVTMLIG
jgi:hypothetical protein